MRLGKQEVKFDPRTAMLANFISPTIVVPSTFNFDKRRAAFPNNLWGNDAWGDCVIAGRANHLLRLERFEQQRTIPLTDQEVIAEYQRQCQAQFGKTPHAPGDDADNGLNVLDAIKSWRNEGWTLRSSRSKSHNYKIEAYGELNPLNPGQIRQAIYLFHGAQLGFWLPRAVQGVYDVWDYNGQQGTEWNSGSWGGHLVYAKAYDETSIEIITWGMKIKVTDSFLKKYCDEAWAVVDSLDGWRARPEFDVTELVNYLRGIGAKV